MRPLVNTSADHIVLVIKDILLRMNLKIENTRRQCHEGASAMADKVRDCNSIKVVGRKMPFCKFIGMPWILLLVMLFEI